MRADAVANRQRIVLVAQEWFRVEGPEASLDEVARRAGVGPGTLYRHFPTRADLVAAVMQTWVDRINERADEATQVLVSPRERLLNWFIEYVDLLRTHRGAASAITAGLGDAASPYHAKCNAYLDATARVLVMLQHENAVPAEVTSLEVCRLIGSVAATAEAAGWQQDITGLLLARLVDGLVWERDDEMQ